MKTSIWKKLFLLSIVAMLLIISFAGYSIIDQAVTISYMRDGYKWTETDLERLGKLFPKSSKKDEILAAIRKEYPDDLLEVESCYVQLDGLRFEFDEEGILERIDTRAQYTVEKDCEPPNKNLQRTAEGGR